MNELNDDAQALFDAARGAHEPTTRDHEHVLRRVLARGALVVSVSSVGAGATAAKTALAAGRVASAVKVLAGFALLGAAGAGAYRYSSSQRPTPAVVVAPLHAARRVPGASPQRVPPPERASEPVPSAAAPVERSRDDVRPAPHRVASLPPSPAEPAPRTTDESVERDLAPRSTPAAAVATQSFPPSPAPQAAASASPSAVTLTREARALAEVQRALREGRSAEALSLLAAQSREFGGGVLGQEREAARIVALCTAGRAVEGRAAAQRFLSANATSPAAAHIRAVCGMPEP